MPGAGTPARRAAATTPFSILVLGGAGVFGSRICRRLARHPGLRIIAAGRRRAALDALAREVGGVEPLALEAPRALKAALARERPDLVIHTAGPFQAQDYAVAALSIEAGAHYIDIADGRDFVANFARLDAAARAANVLAVSGASSVPGLSAAAIEATRAAFARLDRIEIDLSPGNRAPRGPAVIAAFLGYCGRPIARWEGGAWTTVHGWHDLRRGEIDGVGRRWVSACDVPDLVLFPARYPGVRTVTFHAGLELASLHLGLWLLAWLPRLGLGESLAWLSGITRVVGALTRPFGMDRGGMAVTLTGVDHAGGAMKQRWSLAAGAGDGPFVPATPSVVLALKLAAGTLAARGARPCLDLLTLDEFRAEVADLEITDAVVSLPIGPNSAL
jgi:saccharopine dehydrogenase-like NADP-dependent oxidoreductase